MCPQDGLHGGQIAEREGFREIARFFRASGLIGEMNLTTGVKLESTLCVADGSSGDKWQARVFVLSELMQAIVFWIGTKTDIQGSVAQVRGCQSGCVRLCARICACVPVRRFLSNW